MAVILTKRVASEETCMQNGRSGHHVTQTAENNRRTHGARIFDLLQKILCLTVS